MGARFANTMPRAKRTPIKFNNNMHINLMNDMPCSNPSKNKIIKTTTTTSTNTPQMIKKKTYNTPSMKKSFEVKATNDQHASVQKLSAWLESRPYEKKKLTTKKKGRYIL